MNEQIDDAPNVAGWTPNLPAPPPAPSVEVPDVAPNASSWAGGAQTATTERPTWLAVASGVGDVVGGAFEKSMHLPNYLPLGIGPEQTQRNRARLQEGLQSMGTAGRVLDSLPSWAIGGETLGLAKGLGGAVAGAALPDLVGGALPDDTNPAVRALAEGGAGLVGAIGGMRSGAALKNIADNPKVQQGARAVGARLAEDTGSLRLGDMNLPKRGIAGKTFYHGTRDPQITPEKLQVGRETQNQMEVMGAQVRYNTSRSAVFLSDNPEFAKQYGDRVLDVEVAEGKRLNLTPKKRDELRYEFENWAYDRWRALRDAGDKGAEEFRESGLDMTHGPRDFTMWKLFDGRLGKHFTEFLRGKGYDYVTFREATPSQADQSVMVRGQTLAVLNPEKLRRAQPKQSLADKLSDDTGSLNLGVFGKGPKPPTEVATAAETPSDAVGALLKKITEAKPLEAQNKELLGQFRSRQAGAFSGSIKGGEAGFNRGMAAMRGQSERVGFEPLRNAIGQGGVDELFTRLQGAKLRPFEHANAGSALRSIMDGVVPVPSELSQLEKAFPGITKALSDAKIIKGPSLGDYVRDLVTFPQAIKSAFDLSGFRQTATAAYAHPKMGARAFARSLNAFGSEANYKAVNDDLAGRWYAGLRDDAGVVLADGSEQGLTPTERTFIARLTNEIGNRTLGSVGGATAGYASADDDASMGEKLRNAAIGGAAGFAAGTAANKAGVGGQSYRASQRAYATMLNVMRDGLFQNMIKGYGGNPNTIPDDTLRQFGRLVNISTGRGDVKDLQILGQNVSAGSVVNENKVFGSRIFWAPRLFLSRVQLPFELLSSNRQVQKEAFRQLVAFVGVNSTIVGMGAAAGLWEAELDPKSADFGQIRIGNQRIDPWAGFRPIVNLVARMKAGEVTSTTSGETYEKARGQILMDFGRQKFSPATSIAVNTLTGENAIGEDYTAGAFAKDALMPLFFDNIKEAIEVEGLSGLPGAALGGLGAGVNTYEATSGSSGGSRTPTVPGARPKSGGGLPGARPSGGGKLPGAR